MSGATPRKFDRRYYGVVEGIVTAADDPGHQGRVRVRFPRLDDHTVSEWCRVSQLYAGNGYGTLFVPEVGDEVLIAFVHGDMRLPIVLGGLYNGKDKPATYRASDRDQKLIRTKGGHEILLDDTSGQERIVVKDSSNGNTITMDVQQKSITIEAKNGSLILKGQKVEVSSDTTLSLTARATADLTGQTVNLN